MGKSSKDRNPGASSSARLINILLIAGALAHYGRNRLVHAERSGRDRTSCCTSQNPTWSRLIPHCSPAEPVRPIEAAKEVPEVLAQLPCYCGCMSNFGHRNNLDCFHDEHGVECTMCQGIAIDARDMYKDGYEIERIRQSIKDRYGNTFALTRVKVFHVELQQSGAAAPLWFSSTPFHSIVRCGRAQVEFFSERYRVITPDIIGFGGSQPAAPVDHVGNG